MRTIFIILLLFTYTLNAQFLLFSEEVQSLFALDLDGSTEYAYINNPVGLDLNSANYVSGSDADMTNIISGWDFTSGWAVSTGVIDDANSFTTTGDGGVYRVGDLVDGLTYEIRLGGNTDATSSALWDGISTSTRDIITPLVADTTLYYTVDNSSGVALYIRNVGAGTTNIAYFRVTPTNYTSNGDASLSFASDKMEVVATGTTSSDYISISQDNFTSTMEHSKNYTVQFKGSSLASSDLAIKVGNGHGVDLLGGAGSFDSQGTWTNDTEWIIASGVASYDGNASGKKIALSFSTPIYDNDDVKINFTISNAGVGGAHIQITDGSGVSWTDYDFYNTTNFVNGNYSIITKASKDISSGIRLYGYTTSDGTPFSIDNFEITKIGTTISTTGTEATYAYTFEYDSSGMTVENETEWIDTDENGIADGWAEITSNMYSTIEDGYQRIRAHEINGYGRIYKTYTANKVYKVTVTFRGNGAPIGCRYSVDGVGVDAEGVGTVSTANWQTQSFIVFTDEGSNGTRIEVGLHNASLGTGYIEFHTIHIEELPSLQLLPQANDTYTIDDVDVSEAYDLSIEGWFRIDDFVTRRGLYHLTYNSLNYIRLYTTNPDIMKVIVKNDGVEYYRFVSLPNINAWNTHKLTLSPLDNTYKYYINDTLMMTEIDVDFYKLRDFITLALGTDGVYYLDGQIGKTTITRTNGLGETVGTSIYDWSGTSDTFLDDKGTLGNDLTGVNTTTDDVVTYKKGVYE